MQIHQRGPTYSVPLVISKSFGTNEITLGIGHTKYDEGLCLLQLLRTALKMRILFVETKSTIPLHAIAR